MAKSIDIDSPYGDKTEEVIVNILFKGYSISISIPEVPASRLHSLSLLIAQDHLHDILVPVLSSLLQFVFDAVGDVFAGGIEI